MYDLNSNHDALIQWGHQLYYQNQGRFQDAILNGSLTTNTEVVEHLYRVLYRDLKTTAATDINNAEKCRKAIQYGLEIAYES